MNTLKGEKNKNYCDHQSTTKQKPKYRAEQSRQQHTEFPGDFNSRIKRAHRGVTLENHGLFSTTNCLRLNRNSLHIKDFVKEEEET